MPTPQYFSKCPSFPEDTAIADLPTISLPLLESNDKQESGRLFDACRRHGFFLLDLQGSHDGGSLIRSAEKMFDLAPEILNLDKIILDEFAYKPPKDLTGYKQAGLLRTDDGKVDAIDMYTLSQDDILGTSAARKNPEPIEKHRLECREFFALAYTATSVILKALDESLGLPKGTLVDLSSPSKASATSLRFLLARPQDPSQKRISLGAHTDIGLITMLFNVAGGLQILPAGADNKDENWRFIRPRPYCAMINLSDTIVEWTGGLLRSSLHRVVTAPGQQASVPRVSLAYPVRPSHGQSIQRLRSSVIPAVDSGCEDERTVDEWAAEQASNIIKGIVKPRTKGGYPVAVH